MALKVLLIENECLTESFHEGNFYLKGAHRQLNKNEFN